MKVLQGAILLVLLSMVLSCSHTVNVKHEVEPIYITVDVNIKVQKELDDFFDFEEDTETNTGGMK